MIILIFQTRKKKNEEPEKQHLFVDLWEIRDHMVKQCPQNERQLTIGKYCQPRGEARGAATFRTHKLSMTN